MISVIIPTLNEGKVIKRCMESLSKQRFKDFEVVVVDSGSTDGTVRIVKKYKGRVIYEPRRGVPLARNRGVRESKGDIIVCTDGDSAYPSDWLEKIAKHFEDKDVVAVGGPIAPDENKLKHRLIFKVTTNYFPRSAKLLGFVAFQGSNSSFRRDAYEKAGGYDEKIRTLDDNELPNRIKKLGKVVFDPSLVVVTSTRRFDKAGYLRETLHYWRAYIDLYILRKGTSEEYKFYK
ncbi:glycosyltransferase [Candidatus Micrarchaeota archaeon]|nr:glycosyltransferase [Candidatus Micrarchaeota archaeon]